MLKMKIKNIINWILGVIVFLFAVISFSNSKILGGIIFLIISLFLIPYSGKLINGKLGLKVKPIIMAIILIIAFFIAVGFSVDPSDSNNNTKPNKNTGVEIEQNIDNNTQNNFSSPVEEIKDAVNSDITTDSYQVTSVVDGDTIKVSMDGNIETLRLIGINTPETVDPRKPVECFGKEASNKAKELLSGKKVKLEADPSQDNRDKYNRLLRYVYLEDGLFFNKWMVENGFAYEYTYNTPYRYQAEFKTAQKYAQDQKLGLWAPEACAEVIDSVSPSATENNQPAVTGHIYYTSSYSTSRYYYCDTDDGWKALSSKYLKSFGSITELLAAYPNKILHEPCK